MPGEEACPPVGVVLAAAGAGRRFGGKKQLLVVAGRDVLSWSLDAFAEVEDVAQIVVAAAAGDVQQVRHVAVGWTFSATREGKRTVRVDVVPGGARRQDSVLEGLRALGPGIGCVLVHDAARPLIQATDVRRVIAAVRAHGAAALGTPCHDSVKRSRDGEIVEELDREEVWTVQTPQGGRLADLVAAYERAGTVDLTDESSALRALGVRVALVEGPRENLKITRPGDDALAELLLEARCRRGSGTGGGAPRGP
ncbi:MAG: 2-C-methyl-D-erythritol 4-phosphate cytidylyltransferase [Planctomycetes bacterium]|nr:2-C-methyl-D-erythritol 4-phosphate cytidylyltransferase [Planctomycetota bacterium]